MRLVIAWILAALALVVHVGPCAAEPAVLERIAVDKVWSAVQVRFCLMTHGDRQYLAYYNADRRMVVAQRSLDDSAFERFVLPSESTKPPRHSEATSTIQGWDSHNYITMAVDRDGHLHLSGNMHRDPLLYFRSDVPGDITTLTQVHAMVGSEEDHCTYPKFKTAPNGSLLFHYRDGGSGNGNEIYNVYDTATRTWSRFLKNGLISGQGKRNAYQRGPVLGPDGWYHLLWMWRDTPMVETNNNLSYARSRDLLNWETAGGDAIELPITLDDAETIIDPVPVEGGLHNSHQHASFDSQGRFVASYIKHDANDHTQAYVARFDDGDWRVRAVSDWRETHVFRGGGSGPSTFGTSLSIGPVRVMGDGRLAVPYRHWKAGSGLLVVDEATLELVDVVARPAAESPYPPGLSSVESDFPGMRVNWQQDIGGDGDAGSRYVLRWETLGRNRDRPREGELPENSDLVLYQVGR